MFKNMHFVLERKLNLCRQTALHKRRKNTKLAVNVQILNTCVHMYTTWVM